MALKLGVVVYSGADRAQEVLTGFQEIHPTDYWALNVGVIERHKTGRISVYGAFGYDSYWKEEGDAPLAGLSLGALTGVMIGALAGPPGMAVGGSLGALFGGVTGAADEDEEDQPLFDIIRAKLQRGSSALVLLADGPLVDTLIKATGKDARDVYQMEVREELRGRLDEALREAAARPPAAEQKPEAQPPGH